MSTTHSNVFFLFRIIWRYHYWYQYSGDRKSVFIQMLRCVHSILHLYMEVHGENFSGRPNPDTHPAWWTKSKRLQNWTSDMWGHEYSNTCHCHCHQEPHSHWWVWWCLMDSVLVWVVELQYVTTLTWLHANHSIMQWDSSVQHMQELAQQPPAEE